MKNNLIWTNGTPLTDDTYIEQTEKELGIIFPNSFKEIVRKYDGGIPNKPAFVCIDYRSHKIIGAFYHLGYMNPEEIGSVSDISSISGEILPSGVIPFAEDGGGNATCFDYRKNPENPEIVYYYHEHPAGKDILFVAHNFDEFLEMLFDNDDGVPLSER